jgi:hypothetical protein
MRLTATVSDLSELKIIREVFFGGEYPAPGSVDPEVIVDLGGNVRFSILVFMSVCPNARIVAVEFHTGTFQRLRLNTSHLDGVELVNAAEKRCGCCSTASRTSGRLASREARGVIR